MKQSETLQRINRLQMSMQGLYRPRQGEVLELKDGHTIKLVDAAGGPLVMDLHGDLMPPGLYWLANNEKLVVGESGKLIRRLRPEEGISNLIFEQKREAERLERRDDLVRNFEQLMKSK